MPVFKMLLCPGKNIHNLGPRVLPKLKELLKDNPDSMTSKEMWPEIPLELNQDVKLTKCFKLFQVRSSTSSQHLLGGMLPILLLQPVGLMWGLDCCCPLPPHPDSQRGNILSCTLGQTSAEYLLSFLLPTPHTGCKNVFVQISL